VDPAETPHLVLANGSGLTHRLRPVAGSGPVIFMLHGLGGDEDLMWLLASVLPEDGFLIAPRASYPYSQGGFSWVAEPEVAAGGGFEDYQAAVEAVGEWWRRLKQEHGLEGRPVYYMGFSQGAALAFALAAGGQPAAGLIALAGFLPSGDLASLSGTPVYWGHGTKDDRVPLEQAQKDVERLRRAGVSVEFCQAEVGHKVGVECMRGLKAWLNQQAFGPS